MKEAILLGDFDLFIGIMRAAWEAKKNSSKSVSNPLINDYIERATEAGALAAKVSGAGGGFIMYFVPPEYRNNVIKVISDSVVGLATAILPWKVHAMLDHQMIDSSLFLGSLRKLKAEVDEILADKDLKNSIYAAIEMVPVVFLASRKEAFVCGKWR